MLVNVYIKQENLIDLINLLDIGTSYVGSNLVVIYTSTYVEIKDAVFIHYIVYNNATFDYLKILTNEKTYYLFDVAIHYDNVNEGANMVGTQDTTVSILVDQLVDYFDSVLKVAGDEKHNHLVTSMSNEHGLNGSSFVQDDYVPSTSNLVKEVY